MAKTNPATTWFGLGRRDDPMSLRRLVDDGSLDEAAGLLQEIALP
jgi:hypothetical protein